MNSIKLVLFLAWRNVLRYRKRTIQSFLILFCGAFCVMLIDAYMKGFAASSIERVVSQSGHLDVHAVGYMDSAEAMPMDLVIDDADGVMEAMLYAAAAAASPGTEIILSPSVLTGCMLSNGEISKPAAVLAAEPYARASAKRPAPASAPAPTPAPAPTNPMLSDARSAIVAGHYFLDPAEPGALLDEKFANRLGLTVGDSLILLGNDAYGSFSMMETKIIGVVREASLPEGTGCVVDLASFAPVFGLEGKAAAISLWFVSGVDMVPLGSKAEPAAVRSVMAALKGNANLEARPFSAISSSYAAMFEFLDIFLAGMMAIFVLVAGVGMTNAILLSVQDRVRDLGTLRAIALSSRQAGALIYAETLIISLAAAIAALGLGLLMIWILQVSGLGIRFEFSEIGANFPDSIRPQLFPMRLLAISAMSALFPLLAAALPARGVRKLTIRECLSS
ncbi:MAG: FtsX-like permease family protein [Candidatus Shapirobacteria bacterium]|jgi:putative ABC transport system permease protein